MNYKVLLNESMQRGWLNSMKYEKLAYSWPCGWGFRVSGIWSRVTEWSVTGIAKEKSV